LTGAENHRPKGGEKAATLRSPSGRKTPGLSGRLKRAVRWEGQGEWNSILVRAYRRQAGEAKILGTAVETGPPSNKAGRTHEPPTQKTKRRLRLNPRVKDSQKEGSTRSGTIGSEAPPRTAVELSSGGKGIGDPHPPAH